MHPFLGTIVAAPPTAADHIPAANRPQLPGASRLQLPCWHCSKSRHYGHAVFWQQIVVCGLLTVKIADLQLTCDTRQQGTDAATLLFVQRRAAVQ